MFLPKRINVKRKAAWFGDGDLGADKQPTDMSPTDAQVQLPCFEQVPAPSLESIDA